MDEVSAIGTKKQWWLDFWNIPEDEAEAAWKSKLELDAKGGYDAHFGVLSDIQPYKSQLTGEMITSRSTHRNHLKEHGVVEVGTEKPKPKTFERTKQEKHELRQEIAARLASQRS